MATRKQALIQALATARKAKAEKASARRAIREPVQRQEFKPVQTETPTTPRLKLAKACTEQAMLTGWDRAIQKTAYENNISEQEMRNILDQALEYEDKTSPSNKIEGLEDWRNEKRGSSELASPRRR